MTDSIVPHQVRALETIVLVIHIVIYNKEDSLMKWMLVESVYSTKEGKTRVLNVEEAKQFLVIRNPTIEEKE